MQVSMKMKRGKGLEDLMLNKEDMLYLQVNVAHKRQSRPDSGLGFQVKALETV